MPRILVIAMLVAHATFSVADGVPEDDNSINDIVVKVERDLEEWRHSWLYKTIAGTDKQIESFTTDGCSGGMSDGWQHMSQVLPAFREKFGDRPPWEPCCVAHDRAYWVGATENGFEQRKLADEQLRQCVRDYGKSHREERAKQFRLDETIIERQFIITAALMYRAVRVGGQPCTPFPWRWGYGWPSCQAELKRVTSHDEE